MIFLLDTNTFSDLMRGDSITVSRSEAITDQDLAVICPIVKGEILFGISRLPLGSRRQDLQLKADTLFAQLPCYPIPASAADYYADLKVESRRKNIGLDDNDLWIASTVLAFGATLVTRDKDFLQIGRFDNRPENKRSPLMSARRFRATRPSTASSPAISMRSAKSPDADSRGRTRIKIQERGRIDSWFIGFAPVENPKIAWAVVVEGGGYGSRTSAPIAGNLPAPAKSLGLLNEEPAQPKPTPARENTRARR